MRPPKRLLRRQSGATLIIVLIMLVAITLLGIASIRMSSNSMLVVGNMQARRFAENIGNQAIEVVVGSAAYFNNPTSAVTFTPPAGVTVTVDARTCVQTTPAAGYSAVSSISPEDNNWEFGVTVTDTFTGSRTRMIQGIRMRQLSGNCI